jgi:uncharacterized protein (DUF111 family)
VDTRYGAVGVKLVEVPDGSVRVTPEYEDCRRLAEEHGVALRVVQHEAEHAAAHKFGLPHGH